MPVVSHGPAPCEPLTPNRSQPVTAEPVVGQLTAYAGAAVLE